MQGIGIGLADQLRRHLRVVEPLGDAMNDGCLQGAVMQYRRIDERRELRLLACNLLGLLSNLRPDRIHFLDGGGRPHLLARHDHLLHVPFKTSLSYQTENRDM